MVCVAEQMVGELHHVVVDTRVENRIMTVPMAKQVAYSEAQDMNRIFLTDAFRIAFVKRDGSIIVK